MTVKNTFIVLLQCMDAFKHTAVRIEVFGQ